jgi:hypothetical protein
MLWNLLCLASINIQNELKHKGILLTAKPGIESALFNFLHPADQYTNAQSQKSDRHK